jgi:iron complex outermembrane recepter protein
MDRGFIMRAKTFRMRGPLLLFTAFTTATIAGLAAHAQSAATTSSESAESYQVQTVRIKYKRLLLRQKDIPNAVTELGPKQVQAANPTLGSIQTLLTQAPSVVAYSQQPGQDSTTLAIRGVRNDELSETLDGVPINNLMTGSGDYLDAGAVGSPVTLNEIQGVSIYPGLAPPDHQGFGTAGGTIAYTTKQPTDDRYFELEGGFGSFDTQHFGFTINTGKLGTGVDAPKALLLYDQSETAGYVENTPAQFHDFLFDLQKPYDDGLSKLGLIVIFNQGKALVQTLPAPVSLMQAYGYKFNYPISSSFYNQADQNLTTILSDQTYINQYAIFDASLFFLHQTTSVDDYASADATTNGYTYNGITYPPNIQGVNSFFGCVGGYNPVTETADANSHNGPGFTYDPAATFGSCAAGESDEYTYGHMNTVGITPKITIFPDDHNTIVIGGMIAKASENVQPGGATSNGVSYVYGGDGAEENEINGYNSFNLGGGAQRTIFSGYVQDTLRLFDNKLQITPGLKVDAAYSSNIEQVDYGIYSPEKLENFTKIGGYYLGAAYNLPHNFVLYGSLGKGSLFSPIQDYSVAESSGIAGGTQAPTPEIVHLYEAGIRYDTPRLLLNVDYYYQSISDGFAYYENFLLNQEYYANNGGYLFRGVEGNGDFRVTPALSIFGNFSYNEAIYTKSFFADDTLAEDQFGYAFTGTPLSNVPNWTGLVGLDYEQGPFSAYVTGQYTGREFTTYDLVAPPFSGPDTNPLNGATVTNTKIQNPANFVVNMNLTYKIPLHLAHLQALTASLNIQNLLNERYYTYTYSSENPVGGVYDPYLAGGQAFNSAFLGEPRSLMLNLTARF